MSYYLIAEILFTFIFTHYFLHNYINIKQINLVTVISVFICFFFSFLTIIILPSDIASVSVPLPYFDILLPILLEYY